MPAKVIGSFDKFVKLRMLMDKATPYEFERSGAESIDQKAIEKAWAAFDKKKKKEK